MEHRWSSRRRMGVNVVIHSSKGLMSGCAKDMSVRGAYIEMPDDPRLYRNSSVSLVFSLGGKLRWVPAYVVRSAQGGVGLMFTSDAPDTVAALRSLLEGEKEQAVTA